ncbi:hypothetical protein A9Q99_23835 [Gammaproteobacteria bacterium 45_16_T64]|nr:hypothetical protein A9Q99_23835 [Gammaproteobacteria bacterium 45_16_T64]
MIKRSLQFLAVAAATYYLVVSIVVHYFLAELVFKTPPRTETHEDSLVTVAHNGNEVLIRRYNAINTQNNACAIYFPGRHGGIPRYEKEIFGHANALGITIYALSLPGYEGAKGVSTEQSVIATTREALEHIEQNTPCNLSDAVFVGRSLGSSIALLNAISFKPKAILLDSTGPSLATTIRTTLHKSLLGKPATLLPIEKLLQFDLPMISMIKQLEDTPIVIFQGALDSLTPYDDIATAVAGHNNVTLIKIFDATHNDVHIKARPLYLEQLTTLIGKNKSLARATL